MYDARPPDRPLHILPASKAAAMQARLKVLHDKANVKQVKLLPVTLIGRSTDCNLKIASSQVSRNHCRITLGDDAVFVEDLGSANGTLVDGQLLTAHQPTAIAPGARLIVGPAEFQIDYVASTSATMVLSRSGAPPVPELPSTEMIFPTSQFPAQTPSADVAPAAPQTSSLTPQPESLATVEAQQTIAYDAVPAAIEASVPPVAAYAAPPAPDPAAVMPGVTVTQPQQADTEIPSPVADFGFTPSAAEAVDDSAEETQFMFQETVPDAVSTGSGTTAARAEQAHNKGGLKSLFSLFGRKDKPAAAATHKASAAQSATAAPGVFLPTMEAQAEEPGNDQPEFPTSADTAAVTSDQAPPTSTDEDDGFQQFLSNF